MELTLALRAAGVFPADQKTDGMSEIKTPKPDPVG
jgi:hypothetical protein